MMSKAARSAASRKGWESRKAFAAARAQMDHFMSDGTPIELGAERGSQKGDYSIPEILERLRATAGTS